MLYNRFVNRLQFKFERNATMTNEYLMDLATELTFEEKFEIELERMEEINAYAQLATSMGVVW